MIAIDTDVLLLAFAFHRDARQSSNNAFLQQAQAAGAATTVYNVMELLGKLSFNLSPEQLDAWQSWLIDAYQLTVIWPVKPDSPIDHLTFRQEFFIRPFTRMKRFKMPFMDALILDLAERTPQVTELVTWNARHFLGKSSLPVLTPDEYLIEQETPS